MAPSHSFNLELSNSHPKGGNGSWTDQDYQRFYAAVELFKESQQCNKKIAKYMGPHIDFNRIKLEKTRYLK